MMGSSIKEKKNKVWIAIVVGVVFYFLFQMISFPGLTAEGQKAIAFTIIIVFFLMGDLFPLLIISLLIVILTPILGIIPGIC